MDEWIHFIPKLGLEEAKEATEPEKNRWSDDSACSFGSHGMTPCTYDSNNSYACLSCSMQLVCAHCARSHHGGCVMRRNGYIAEGVCDCGLSGCGHSGVIGSVAVAGRLADPWVPLLYRVCRAVLHRYLLVGDGAVLPSSVLRGESDSLGRVPLSLLLRTWAREAEVCGAEEILRPLDPLDVFRALPRDTSVTIEKTGSMGGMLLAVTHVNGPRVIWLAQNCLGEGEWKKLYGVIQAMQRIVSLDPWSLLPFSGLCSFVTAYAIRQDPSMVLFGEPSRLVKKLRNKGVEDFEVGEEEDGFEVGEDVVEEVREEEKRLKAGTSARQMQDQIQLLRARAQTTVEAQRIESAPDLEMVDKVTSSAVEAVHASKELHQKEEEEEDVEEEEEEEDEKEPMDLWSGGNALGFDFELEEEQEAKVRKRKVWIRTGDELASALDTLSAALPHVGGGGTFGRSADPGLAVRAHLPLDRCILVEVGECVDGSGLPLIRLEPLNSDQIYCISLQAVWKDTQSQTTRQQQQQHPSSTSSRVEIAPSTHFRVAAQTRVASQGSNTETDTLENFAIILQPLASLLENDQFLKICANVAIASMRLAASKSPLSMVHTLCLALAPSTIHKPAPNPEKLWDSVPIQLRPSWIAASQIASLASPPLVTFDRGSGIKGTPTPTQPWFLRTSP